MGRAHFATPQSLISPNSRLCVRWPVPSESSTTSRGATAASTSASAHIAGLAANTPPSTIERASASTGSK
jgi:hypothetical protein